WQTSATSRGSPTSGSSRIASNRPAGPGINSVSMRLGKTGDSIGAVVGELHVDAEVVLFEQMDDFLQRVAIFSGYAHQDALDRRLHLLLAFLDRFHDFTRLLDRDSLLKRDLLPHARTRSRLNHSVFESLQRHLPLHQLLLKNLVHGLQLELVLACENHFVILLVELNI